MAKCCNFRCETANCMQLCNLEKGHQELMPHTCELCERRASQSNVDMTNEERAHHITASSSTQVPPHLQQFQERTSACDTTSPHLSLQTPRTTTTATNENRPEVQHPLPPADSNGNHLGRPRVDERGRAPLPAWITQGPQQHENPQDDRSWDTPITPSSRMESPWEDMVDASPLRASEPPTNPTTTSTLIVMQPKPKYKPKIPKNLINPPEGPPIRREYLENYNPAPNPAHNTTQDNPDVDMDNHIVASDLTGTEIANT